MVYLVLPRSAAPFRQKLDVAAFIKEFFFDAEFVQNMSAMVLSGLIVSYCARNAGAADTG